MATIKPELQLTSYDGGSSFSQMLARASYVAAAAWTPALPYVLNAGVTQDTDPVQVAGFNSFMALFLTAGAGGTVDFSYNIIDPHTPATILATRSLRAALNPAVFLISFGAFSTGNVVDTSADVFITIGLRFKANTAQQTISLVNLFCGVR
jgi:hypothetical protein